MHKPVALFAIVCIGSTGCVGVFVDLHGSAYPALRTSPHPADVTLPDGPKPLVGAKPGTAIGVTVGVELDDGRSSRWAVGYSADSIELAGGADARQHFNDLRVDVTVKSLSDDTRLRVAVGGGIGAGKVRLPRDDGAYLSVNGGSAVVYSGPVFVQYVGDHSIVSAMVGGSFVVIGAKDWVIRGWGLTSHVTYTYAFDDTHGDVVLYRAMPREVSVADYAAAAKRIGCTVTMGEDQKEDVAAAFLVCEDAPVELHAPDDTLHVHCERSTPQRCRKIIARIENALPEPTPR